MNKIGSGCFLCALVFMTSCGEINSLGENPKLNQITPHWDQIADWADCFEGDSMPDEAAAFMYMMLATQEFHI